MNKALSFVLGLACFLSLGTSSMAQSQTGGWDFSVKGIQAIAEKSRTGNYYRMYVTVRSDSTNQTYGGYGTVRVVLRISDPNSGEELFREVEKVEIKNGKSETVEFSFNRDVHYSYFDYVVNIQPASSSGIFDNESGNLSVDWRKSKWD